MPTDKPGDWRPEGWAGWTHEQRRIWRLELQLRRWEALAFAARSLAYEQAVIVAELRGEAAPTQAAIDQVVMESGRVRWNLPDNEVPERRPLLESDPETEQPAGGA